MTQNCLSLSLMSSWRNVHLMYMGGTSKQMRMKKRKSESCIALVIYKVDSHIMVTRDDGNLDAVMAEDFAPWKVKMMRMVRRLILAMAFVMPLPRQGFCEPLSYIRTIQS